jgi:hypothetical protein
MIDTVVYEISTGMLIQAQQGQGRDRGPLFASFDIPEELLGEDMSKYYLLDEVLTLRPTKPSFELEAIVDQPLVFTNLQDGATVVITDRLNSRTSFVYDSNDPLVFTEIGDYYISIEQTYPSWSILNEKLEVSNA